MSNSPLRGLTRSPSRSRGACSAPGLSRRACLHRISAACAGASAGSRPNPWRQLQLRPRHEGAGGAPGGVLPLTVALVRRDVTLARRAPSRATGTPPLGAPPWRCRPRNRSGPVVRIRPEGCSRPAIVHGGLRDRAFRSRAHQRGRRHSPLRLLDRLRRRPLMSEDDEVVLYIRYVVNN